MKYTVRKYDIKPKYKADVQYFGAEFCVRFVPVQYHTIIAAAHQEQGLSEDGVIEMDGKRATSWTRPEGLRRGTEGKRRAPQDGPDPASFPCLRYLARYGFGYGHDHLDGWMPYIVHLKLRPLAPALQVAAGYLTQ